MDTGSAVYKAAAGKVGAGDDFNELIEADIRIVNDRAGRIDHLSQIVWRNIGGHADRNTSRAIHQQIRQCCGEDGWLSRAFLVVGHEINGIFVDILKHLFGDRFEFTLSITIRSRRIAVD